MMYRTSAGEPELSETAKLIKDNERQMMETFARLLSETDPRELTPLTQKLDHLAHERCLAIRFETMRLQRDFRPLAFTVTDEGLIVEVEIKPR